MNSCLTTPRSRAFWPPIAFRFRTAKSSPAWPGIFLTALILTRSASLAAEPSTSYTLDLREPTSHLVRVTWTIPEAGPTTLLQFPTWNNLYQIRDFVRNVQQLTADCDGRSLELLRADLTTWQSGPEACARLEVRYAVYANDESIFSAVLNDQHAFLNLALLLFYLPRQRQRPAQVKFLLPGGWKLATLLKEGGVSGEFQAANYDLLVDSPAEAGSFQDYSYTQSGATYRVVVHADPADYPSDRLLSVIEKITATETSLMRDVPFERYTFILHFPHGRAGGGMEHRHGTAISVRAESLRRNWVGFEATLAHEFFHAWNVKRIRPQALEPVDYVHGNDTRDLWFSEGVTSTYQELVLVRAGLISREEFYQRLAAEIAELEARPARRFQSAEDSGREAWFEKYGDYFRPERSISYYNKGALLGFLLDLAIRHASHNRHSLDDVMRRLNEDFARRGRFFTQADLRDIIADLAPEFTGLDTFFRDYLSGLRELDYPTYLGYAGLHLATHTLERPALGFLAVQSFDGPLQVESVEPDSDARRAGLERRDILLKLNGRTLTELPENEISLMKPGQKVKLDVRRGRRTLKFTFGLAAKQQTTYLVEPVEHAAEEQLQVREGWLVGKTENPKNK
jgi:predicted metalloprotease with PDZ domain